MVDITWDSTLQYAITEYMLVKNQYISGWYWQSRILDGEEIGSRQILKS